MVYDIVKGEEIFAEKSKPASKNDIEIALSLQDTLLANRYRCVGMAANMIGFKKRIIAVMDNDSCLIMINPVIRKKLSGVYETEEGCLSLDGVRPTKRYRQLQVEYFNINFKKHLELFDEFTAQIIQHEIDHLDGKII